MQDQNQAAPELQAKWVDVLDAQVLALIKEEPGSAVAQDCLKAIKAGDVAAAILEANTIDSDAGLDAVDALLGVCADLFFDDIEVDGVHVAVARQCETYLFG